MDQDVPIYFIATSKPGAMLVRITIGAGLGLLWYLNDKYIINNVMRHCNHAVIEEYHPHLLNRSQ